MLTRSCLAQRALGLQFLRSHSATWNRWHFTGRVLELNAQWFFVSRIILRMLFGISLEFVGHLEVSLRHYSTVFFTSATKSLMSSSVVSNDVMKRASDV